MKYHHRLGLILILASMALGILFELPRSVNGVLVIVAVTGFVLELVE